MTFRRSFAAVLLVPLLWTGAAAAQTGGGAAATYTQCLALAQDDASAALRMAEEWITLGGGNPARHCAAMALLGLLRYNDAAIRLQTLVDLLADAPVERRAAALEQAAQVWLLAGRPERAEQDLSAAIALRPDDAELLISRAIARASATDYWNAIDDLNLVIDAEPNRLDALVLRATAYRYLDSLELARQDVERAVAIAPMDPDARLERSLILWRMGEREGAVADWQQIIESAPESGAAALAKENIDRLLAPEDE